MGNRTELITYSELLNNVDKNSNNHLLLGNGFNNSLGVKTDYKSIFERMLKEESIYEKIKSKMQQYSYNVEKLIGVLSKSLNEEKETYLFLNDYIRRKIRYDFMKAASSIVREQVRCIYQDSNQDIYLLFKNFTNYFTLNYDTFLYLLLMKFKKAENQEAVAFINTPLFQEKDLDQAQNNIYKEIKEAREKGKIHIIIRNVDSPINLNKCKKGEFEVSIRQYSKNRKKNWKVKDIKRVCDQIWEEEKKHPKLKNVNDGFIQGEFLQGESHQNIFFLHGSFHIYENGSSIRKITQKQNRALYERLEEIIQADEGDIICILANESKDKVKQINNNQYLKKCIEKLSSLSGNIVIFGSSLAENDAHIFNAINRSSINNVYISSSKGSHKHDYEKALLLFQKKTIILFDYTTIPYP